MKPLFNFVKKSSDGDVSEFVPIDPFDPSPQISEKIQRYYSVLNCPIIDRCKLESLCFNGIPEETGELKALCWKILLDYLPLHRAEWDSHLQRQRELYQFYITLLFQTPDFSKNDANSSDNSAKHKHTRRGSQPLDSESMAALLNSNRSKKSSQMRPTSPMSVPPRSQSAVFSPRSAAAATETANRGSVGNSNPTHSKYHFPPSVTMKMRSPKKRPNYAPPKPPTHKKKKKSVPLQSDSLFANESDEDLFPNSKATEKAKAAKKNDLFDSDSDDEERYFETKKATKLNVTTTIDSTVENTPEKSVDTAANTTIVDDTTTQTSPTTTLIAPELLQSATQTTPRHESTEVTAHTPPPVERQNSNAAVVEFEAIASNCDPLSEKPNINNPWKNYFADWEIWNKIEKDIHRTHQAFAFFRSNAMIHEQSMSKSYQFPFDAEILDPTVIDSRTGMPMGMGDGGAGAIDPRKKLAEEDEDEDDTDDDAVVDKGHTSDSAEMEIHTASESGSPHPKPPPKISEPTPPPEPQSASSKPAQSPDAVLSGLSPEVAVFAAKGDSDIETYADGEPIKLKLGNTSDLRPLPQEQELLDMYSPHREGEDGSDAELNVPDPILPDGEMLNAVDIASDEDRVSTNDNEEAKNESSFEIIEPLEPFPPSSLPDATDTGAAAETAIDDENEVEKSLEKQMGTESDTNASEPEENDPLQSNKPKSRRKRSYTQSDFAVITGRHDIATRHQYRRKGGKKKGIPNLVNAASSEVQCVNRRHKKTKRRGATGKRKQSNRLKGKKTFSRIQRQRIERYALTAKDLGIHAQVMVRILCVYARLNKGVEYVQGMNELLAPIYFTFANDISDNAMYAEADAFFCFMNMMSYLSDRFIPENDNSQIGILAIVNDYDTLLRRVDEKLWVFLKEQNLDPRFYALRWLMLLMAMEFQLPDVLRLWDSFLSDAHRFELVTYFAVAMILRVKDRLYSGNFAANLQLLQAYPIADPYELLRPAVELRSKYPSEPKKSNRMRIGNIKSKMSSSLSLLSANKSAKLAPPSGSISVDDTYISTGDEYVAKKSGKRMKIPQSPSFSSSFASAKGKAMTQFKRMTKKPL